MLGLDSRKGSIKCEKLSQVHDDHSEQSIQRLVTQWEIGHAPKGGDMVWLREAGAAFLCEEQADQAYHGEHGIPQKQHRV